MSTQKIYYPVTPGGTVCTWLESLSEEEAWEKLMHDARHMPYETKQDFINRGYEICEAIPEE